MSVLKLFLYAIPLMWLWLTPAAAQPPAAEKSPTPFVKIIKPAAAPILRLPIDCTVGKDCWVLNYPDAGPDKDDAAHDPACLARTYEGHKGTDIAIADIAAMNKGVNVLAAMDGQVMRVRNAEDDHFPLTKETLDKIKTDKKECGNAVLIQHADGWQTMYCHMKHGSITVKPNQMVKAGDKLGQVGTSGMTQFPHIHLGVIHNATVIDPFTNSDLTSPCGAPQTSLFSKSSNLTYEPLTIMKLGFRSESPTLEKIDQGQESLSVLPQDAKALVFYAVLLGVRENDEITLKIMDSSNRVFSENKTVQAKDRARQMLFTGRKIPENVMLEPGEYKASVTIKRKDASFTKSASITIH